ncbi:hypothetical protein ETD86_24670, partial [Nonomuraea turkmeniaca]
MPSSFLWACLNASEFALSTSHACMSSGQKGAPSLIAALGNSRAAAVRVLEFDMSFRPACRAGPEAEHRTIGDAARTVLRMLARRILALTEEIRAHERALVAIITECVPKLLQRQGIGPDTPAALLITAGDNPDLLGSVRRIARGMSAMTAFFNIWAGTGCEPVTPRLSEGNLRGPTDRLMSWEWWCGVSRSRWVGGFEPSE